MHDTLDWSGDMLDWRCDMLDWCCDTLDWPALTTVGCGNVPATDWLFDGVPTIGKDYLHSSRLRESYSTMLLYGFSRLQELLMKNEKYLLLVGLQVCAIHPSWKNCAVQLRQSNSA